MTTGVREMRFLLAGPEGRILRALAARVPRSIRSNHLTAIGTIGAAAAGIAYALTTYHPAWLWVASAMLVVNWTLGIILAGMVALFVGRFVRNLYRLAKLEPQRFRWWETGGEGGA